MLFFFWMLASSAFGQNVLVLWDDAAEVVPLSDGLTTAGFTVTLSDTAEFQYDGTNPAPDAFDVVIHLDGTSYTQTIPAAGQSALVEYVRNGGGLVNTEWHAYQVGGGDYTADFVNLVLLERTSGGTANRTYTAIDSMKSHPVVASIPEDGVLIPNVGHNVGGLRAFSVDPSVALAEDEDGNVAVAVREYQMGRVVSFSHAGTYSSGEYSSGMMDLFVDAVDWSITCIDEDKDGARAMECGGDDCDDSDPLRFPGNEEVCDGIDNDCDNVIPTNELDEDNDGTSTCEGDCDDADPARFPGNEEICDRLDNDCDDVLPGEEQDVDEDGVAACEMDCDDEDDRRFPGNAEICDTIDNDCNDEADDGLEFFDVYPDSDGDGYGDDSSAESVCEQPGDKILLGGDCDDGSAAIFPGSLEIKNSGYDEDCDGVSLEGCGCSAAPLSTGTAFVSFLSMFALARRRRQ